jgi:SOS-response transcriptional repressor LexA
MTQQDLGDRCGVSRAAVAQWESGATHPSTERLVKAGAALNVDAGYLLGGSHSVIPADPAIALAGRPIPIIGFDQALHLPEAIAQLPGATVLIVDSPLGPDCFALVVKDKSMAQEFDPGDRVIVDPEVRAEPGDFVVAQIQGEHEALLRKFRLRGAYWSGEQECELVPLNPDWPTARINAESPGTIIGTVVETRRYRHPGHLRSS